MITRSSKALRLAAVVVAALALLPCKAQQGQLANTPNDVEKLNEVRSGVANLAESWRALVA